MIRLLCMAPRWLATGVILAAILWLTLAPAPLPEKPGGWFDFEGADKVAHAAMFALLGAAMTIDRWRGHGRSAAIITSACVVVLTCAAIGILIELAQAAMGLGRSCEATDAVADAAGAAAGTAVASFLIRRESNHMR